MPGLVYVSFDRDLAHVEPGLDSLPRCPASPGNLLIRILSDFVQPGCTNRNAACPR
jgi:hypothetical protein